jgi:hypothetical protein
MPIVPKDWSVVVVGRWNRAILTPAGIATRLFELSPDTPVQIFVPLDGVAPYQVRHENQTVIAADDRLTVQPLRSDYDGIVGAMAVVRRALADLPRTPVVAAGFNLRYRSEEPIETLQRLADHPWDDELSDEHYEIVERVTTRAVRWKNGTIRASVTQAEDLSSTVLLNFELRSEDVAALQGWIDVSAEDVRRETERILFNCMRITREEIVDA